METLILVKGQLVLGVSLNNDHANAGYSPEERGHNLEYSQGAILYPQPAPVDLSANVTGNIIAFENDPNFLGNDAYAVDASGAFYTIDGTTVTKRQTDSTNSYAYGTTDMKYFRGALYATTTQEVVQLQGSDLSTIDDDFWTDTESRTALQNFYRHPLEVVEDTLYIADKNMIHTWDATDSVYAAMSLPDSFNITSLRVHTDGRHLMAFCSETVNYSHTQKARAKIYLIDTVTLEFIREIDVDDQTEGTINAGGVTYVTYGKNFGYFNGDGYTFLRKLNTLEPTYNHGLASKDGIVLIRERPAILAYGDIGTGQNVFWYPFFNTVNGNSLGAIGNQGDNRVLASYTSNKLAQIDFDLVNGTTAWKSNPISFSGKVWIRKIVIETEPLASGSDHDFYMVNKNGTQTLLFSMTYSEDGAISEKTKMVNIYTDLIWFKWDWIATPKGVKKITIFYESGE